MPTRATLPLRTCRLGRVPYVETARLQRSLRAAREAGAVDDLLLLLEHDPVITCGTRTEPDEVAFARTTTIPLVPVERGGKATYHGPGQVVAYPIIDLQVVDGDVRQLVWRLEESIIEALGANGVATARRDGLPGVWVAPDSETPRKIASVGLRLTRGVTFHGIAVNVACDLQPFSWFTPCGIADAQMTSLARELGLEAAPPDQLAALVANVERELATQIADRFAFAPSPVTHAQLRDVAGRFPVEDPNVTLPGEPRIRPATRIDLTTGAPA